MKIGYARVSKREQNNISQLDLLKQAGCQKIFTEKRSAVKDKNVLNKLINSLKPGDTLVVTRLDRLGRSVLELVQLIDFLNKKNVKVYLLKEPLDIDSAVGKFAFHIRAATAEFERDLLIERSIEGINAAKKRGRNGGRPKGLSTEALKTAERAKKMYNDNTGNQLLTIREMCDLLNISTATFYRYLRAEGIKKPPNI